MATEFERPFPLPKEYLDTLNSLCWFFGDACWMTGAMEIGHAFMIPTILTSVFLIYIDRRRTHTLINLALFCWILMNTFWMSSEYFDLPDLILGSQLFFVMGGGLIVAAIVVSRSYRETFSHFKRFRFLRF